MSSENGGDVFSVCVDATLEMGVDAAREYVDDHVNAGYEEGIETGLERSVRCLFISGAAERKALSALCEVCCLDRMEAVDRIAYSKRILAVERLEEHLRCQGLSALEIKQFNQEYQLRYQLRREPELVTLWNELKSSTKSCSKVGPWLQRNQFFEAAYISPRSGCTSLLGC